MKKKVANSLLTAANIHDPIASISAAINETTLLENDNQDVIDGVGGGGDPEATVEK
jgi:hypothetical protein